MGTFEKLGILVIVVIIVMILAVAISQWGGMASDAETKSSPLPNALTIRDLDEIAGPERVGPAGADETADDPTIWPGVGIPKVYVIQPRDKVWVLVVKRWKLKDTFIPAIAAANPNVDMKRLREGQRLIIPDPAPYVRTSQRGERARVAGARRYEVQIGDKLEIIARKHLGSRSRWKDIVAINPGLEPKDLREGQVILIPAK